jgi:methyl-galactoside transport system substrate-binding protein
MKEKKRLAILAAAVVLVAIILLLVGMRKPPETAVGICYGDTHAINRYGQIADVLMKENVAVYAECADNDPAKQTQCVRKLIDSKVKLLIVEAISDKAAQEAAALAKEAEIPIIFIGQEPSQTTLDSWDRISYVGCKPEQAGRLQGSILQGMGNMGDMNGDGVISYLILTGPEDDARAKALTESCVSALASQELGVAEIGTNWGQWDAENAKTACAQALAQYGKDIEVIFCGNDRIAQGAQQAVQDGGWQVGKDYYLLGLGGTEEAIRMIEEGTLTATVSESCLKQGQKIVELLTQMAEETAVEKRYYIEPETITPGNAKDFLK